MGSRAKEREEWGVSENGEEKEGQKEIKHARRKGRGLVKVCENSKKVGENKIRRREKELRDAEDRNSRQGRQEGGTLGGGAVLKVEGRGGKEWNEREGRQRPRTVTRPPSRLCGARRINC